MSLKVFFKKTCSTYTNKDPNDLQSELQEDSLFIATSTALKSKRKHEDFQQNNLNYEKSLKEDSIYNIQEIFSRKEDFVQNTELILYKGTEESLSFRNEIQGMVQVTNYEKENIDIQNHSEYLDNKDHLMEELSDRKPSKKKTEKFSKQKPGIRI